MRLKGCVNAQSGEGTAVAIAGSSGPAEVRTSIAFKVHDFCALIKPDQVSPPLLLSGCAQHRSCCDNKKKCAPPQLQI